MLTLDKVQNLASRPERALNTVLTLYLDVDQSRPVNQNRGFERQLKDLLSSVAHNISDEIEKKAFETASRRIWEYIAKYDAVARGLVLVCDAADGYFWSQDAEFPVENEVRWTNDVFVSPLAIAFEYEPVGIVLLDRAKCRLLSMYLGEMVEQFHEGFDHRTVRHTKTVGMDHIGSASHAQRRADEQIKFNFKRVVRELQRMLQMKGGQRVILAGSPEVTSELRKIMPKRLAASVIGTVDIATAATLKEIRNAVTPLIENCQRESEHAIVGNMVTAAAKTKRVVVGLGRSINALNQRRVWTLVYAAEFHAGGFECTGCSALFSIEAPVCSMCGGPVRAVEDVMERAIDHALRTRTRLQVIRSEPALAELIDAGGIGAFLHTRKAAAQLS